MQASMYINGYRKLLDAGDYLLALLRKLFDAGERVLTFGEHVITFGEHVDHSQKPFGACNHLYYLGKLFYWLNMFWLDKKIV